jgi:hypothetical protein
VYLKLAFRAFLPFLSLYEISKLRIMSLRTGFEIPPSSPPPIWASRQPRISNFASLPIRYLAVTQPFSIKGTPNGGLSECANRENTVGRNGVEGQIPGGVPGILPLVRHGDDVLVHHVEPFPIPQLPAARPERIHAMFLQHGSVRGVAGNWYPYRDGV